MPVVRYEIRNEYGLGDPDLYGAAESDDPEALLEGVAMAGLVGVLRQLGDLAEFAAEIFNDLHEEVMSTSARGHTLMLRVQQLEVEFPAIEKAVFSQATHSHLANNAGIDWHPNNQLGENPITQGDMPRFILNSYEECRGPPQLFTLDKFDVAGAGACLKRYSDPSFFKTDFAPSGRIESELQREKRSRKTKRKGTRWRNGETLESLMKPDRDSKTLVSGKNPESLSLRRVKLKTRPVSSFATRIGRSYMESILDRKLPDQSDLGGNSLYNFHRNSKSNDPEPEIHEIMVDTSSRKPFFRGTGQPHSSIDQNVTENNDGIRKQVVVNDIPKPLGVSGINKLSSLVGNDANKHSSGDNAHKAIDHSSELERTGSAELVSKTDGGCDACLSDDVASEFENYVDALTTMDSEMETDTESKAQQERSVLITESQGVNSGSDEEQEEPSVKYSDLPAFNSLSKEKLRIDGRDFSGNFAERNLSQDDETSFDEGKNSVSCSSTSLPENLGKLLDNDQGTTCLSLQENMRIMPSESSQYMNENEVSNINAPDASGITSESVFASDSSHAAVSTSSAICSGPQVDSREVQPSGSDLSSGHDVAICESHFDSAHLITEEEEPHNTDLNALLLNHEESMINATGDIEFPFRSVEVVVKQAENSDILSNALPVESYGIEDLNSMITYIHHGNELSVECPVATACEDAETMIAYPASSVVDRDSVFQTSSSERSQGSLLSSVEEQKEIIAVSLENDDGVLEIIHIDVDSKYLRAERSNEKTSDVCGSSTQILDIQNAESKHFPATEDQLFHDSEGKFPDTPSGDMAPFLLDVPSNTFDDKARDSLVGFADHPGLPTIYMSANIPMDKARDSLVGFADHPGLPTIYMSANIPMDTFSIQKNSSSFHLETKSNSVGVESDTLTSDSASLQNASDSGSKIQEEIVSHDLVHGQHNKELSRPNKDLVLTSEDTPPLCAQKEDTEISTPARFCFEEGDKVTILDHHNNNETLDHCIVDSPDCSTSLVLNHSPQNGLVDDVDLSMSHSDASGFDMVLLDVEQVPNVNDLIFSSSQECSSTGSVVDHLNVRDTFSKTLRDPFGGLESQQQPNIGDHVEDEPRGGSSESWFASDISVSVHPENGEPAIQNICEKIFHSPDSSESPNRHFNADLAVQVQDVQNTNIDKDSILSVEDLNSETSVCKTSNDSTCMSPVISANMESLPETPSCLQCNNSMDKTPSLDYFDTMSLLLAPLVAETQKISWDTEKSNDTKGLHVFPHDTENRSQSGAEASISFQSTHEMFARFHENINKLDIEPKNASLRDSLVDEACNAQQSSSQGDISRLGNQQELETHLQLNSSSNVIGRCTKDISKLDTSPKKASDISGADAFVPIGSSSEISPTSLGSKSDALFLASPSFPSPTLGTVHSFFPKPGKLGQVSTSPIPYLNASQGTLNDPPPLPPLPPLQWRLGKLRIGPKVAQSATKAELNYHPSDLVSEQSRGYPKLSGEETLCRNSFVDGRALEQTLFASKHDNMENGRHGYRMITVEGEAAHRSEYIDTAASLEDDKYFGRLKQSVAAQPPNRCVSVQMPRDERIESISSNLTGEQKEPTNLPVPSMMSEKDAPQVDVLLSANHLVQYSSPFPVASIGEDDKLALHNGDFGVENLRSPSLFMPSPAMQEVTAQHNVFLTGYENFYSPYPAISSITSNQPNGRSRSILNRPRDPLIEAVASHDKSTLRKVSEMEKTSIKPKADERNTLLEQIRNKSFNLKPLVSTKPKVNRPATNLKLAAILEKANAIRQAFVGSDDDDDDNWSDC